MCRASGASQRPFQRVPSPDGRGYLLPRLVALYGCKGSFAACRGVLYPLTFWRTQRENSSPSCIQSRSRVDVSNKERCEPCLARLRDGAEHRLYGSLSAVVDISSME